MKKYSCFWGWKTVPVLNRKTGIFHRNPVFSTMRRNSYFLKGWTPTYYNDFIVEAQTSHWSTVQESILTSYWSSAIFWYYSYVKWMEFDGVKSLDTYSISTCVASGIVKAWPCASNGRKKKVTPSCVVEERANGISSWRTCRTNCSA